ncbi:MAG: inositol monophosphatase family protein, partial [Pseudomonadales bacterium]
MDAKLTDELIALTREAGEAILEVYQTDFEVETKSDESPLTQADLAAHRVIAERLAQLTPEIPLLSEESTPPEFAERQTWTRYWLVDPLDGTKEFVNRNGEFT